MRLRLLISDERPDLLAIWREALGDLKDVHLIQVSMQNPAESSDVDAELMMGMFAHERYGGSPELGVSQILSTRGEQGMPPWVITTVSSSGHLEPVQGPNGRPVEAAIVLDRPLTPEQDTYLLFTEVFRRIKKFNAAGHEPKIRTLAFNLDFLNFPLGDPHQEALALRSAYLEQFGEVLLGRPGGG